MQGWVHSIWICTLHAHSVSQFSVQNLALCCSNIKLKKAELNSITAHHSLHRSRSLLLLCVAIPVYSKHRCLKEYNQYIPDAWWDGTHFRYRALYASRVYQRIYSMSEEHFRQALGRHVCRSCIMSHYCVNILGMICTNALMEDGLAGWADFCERQLNVTAMSRTSRICNHQLKLSVPFSKGKWISD